MTSEKDTIKLAQDIAKFVVAGDLIRLEGDLGTGKSTFARAVIRALGTKEDHIPSPTFTLMQTYDDTRIPIAHVDLYRTESPEEVADLALDPWLKHGLLLVEWPEKGGDELSQTRPDFLKHNPMETDNGSTLTITLEEVSMFERRVTFDAGESWQKRLSVLLPNDKYRKATPEGRERFVESLGLKGHVLQPLTQDASFRSYYRIKTPDGPRILMDAPPPIENVKPFIEIDKHLRKIGIHAPEIFEKDIEKGYLLLEDLGNTTVRTGITEKDVPLEPWYYRAVDVLAHIANSDLGPAPKYSHEMLWSEVARFVDWYLPYITGCATNTADRQWFMDAWMPLFDKIMDVPKTTTLWDFHGDNMMMLSDLPGEGIQNVGIIDFQDARVGPITYDLSMLLQDARFELSDDMERKLIERFIGALDCPVDYDKFMTSYNLINVQRTMKIIGGFTRLACRDGKPEYLQFMPRCWNIVDKALKDPELEPIKHFMNRVVPAQRELKIAL